MDAAIGWAGSTFDQPQALELRDLAADGRVIAPGSVRELDHADRPEALDPHQQLKEGSIQGEARLREQRLIALRQVHDRDQIDHGSVELAELLF